jgi:hypothetical protein
VLRVEAGLLIVPVFLGFNVSWPPLFDDRHPSRARSSDNTE